MLTLEFRRAAPELMVCLLAIFVKLFFITFGVCMDLDVANLVWVAVILWLFFDSR